MLKINLALLWIMATLPSFAQHTEVIVKRTDVVQVSNGDESPNVSQVNSVTIYYISCNNVIYCGPSTDASSSNTYTFESATNPLWTMPSLLSSGAFTPAAMPTSIDASVSSSMPIWLSTSIPALETDTGSSQQSGSVAVHGRSAHLNDERHFAFYSISALFGGISWLSNSLFGSRY